MKQKNPAMSAGRSQQPSSSASIYSSSYASSSSNTTLHSPSRTVSAIQSFSTQKMAVDPFTLIRKDNSVADQDLYYTQPSTPQEELRQHSIRKHDPSLHDFDFDDLFHHNQCGNHIASSGLRREPASVTNSLTRGGHSRGKSTEPTKYAPTVDDHAKQIKAKHDQKVPLLRNKSLGFGRRVYY